jgi:hypothetical protein
MSKEVTYLQDFIFKLQGELRTGGGATLDELYDLAIAIQRDMEELAPKPADGEEAK